MTFTILILYTIILLFIGLQSFKKIKNYSDFFIARNTGTITTITGSLVATILGGSAIIGTIDEGSKYGWAATWFMLCAAFGLLALLPLVKKVRKLGKFTLPDLLGNLYGTKVKFIASIVIPLAWLGITAAQIIASAQILQSFTGLNYLWGVIISGTVFVIYTIAGGQISILKTDFVQAIFVLASMLVLLVFASENFNSNIILDNQPSFPFNQNFGVFDLFILIITYSLTFTVGPDIYSRIFSANSDKTARNSVLATALILIPVALIIGFLATYGTSLGLLPKNGSVIIQLSKLVLPNWIVPLMILGLLSAVLSSADTTLLSASIIIVDLIDKNKFNNRSIVKTRTAIFIVGIVSIVIAANYSSIIGMLLFALSVYSGAFIVPILLGLSGFTVKQAFVSTAIFLGGITAFIGKIVHFSGNTKTGNFIIVLAFVLNAIVMVLGHKKCRSKGTAFTPKT